MTKPDCIQRLENTLGTQLTDLADLPAQQKIIDWQAHVNAFAAEREAELPAFRLAAALDRMRMSVCRNTYLCDEKNRVLAINLYQNNLKEFPFGPLQDWAELRVLFLAENELPEFFLPAALPRLEHLDLSDNPNLHSLRFEAALPALETLDASDSGLTRLELPAGLGRLKTLDVSRNKLAEVEFKGDCQALEWLDLSGNGLAGFQTRHRFEQLEYLYLNNNAIKALSFAAPLPRLNTLHLRGNQLEELPANLYLFQKLESLYLHGNPLPKVPKGSSGVPEGENDNAAAAIRNYLRSISEDEPAPIDEVKLVLLGNSTAGKSSLMRYLKDGMYDETIPSTHGISNMLWEPDELDFKVNVWDFGGQEFYHATHRLFLTENALSLVAFESATNRPDEIELDIKIYENGALTQKRVPVEIFPYTFWLENLRYYCNDRQTARLVQTKMDIGEPVRIESGIKSEFRLPDDMARISVKAAYGREKPFDRKFEDFKEFLFEALQQAKGKYPFSKKWLRIKNELRKKAAAMAVPVLSSREYVAFCEKIRPRIHEKAGEQEKSMLDTLTDYLHETGVLLYFRNIPELKDKVFIRPDWVTDAIYRVLDYTVMRNNGQFDRDHVATALAGFDVDDMLRIMEKFEIIFPVNNKPGAYVAPQYLSDQDPLKQAEGAYFYQKNAEACRETLFVLRFPSYLPRSVLTRFMCKFGPLARETYWKNGIQFWKDDTLVWVERRGALDLVVRANKKKPELTREFFGVFCRILGSDPNGDEGSTAGSAGFGKINSELRVSGDDRDFFTLGKLINHPGKAELPKIERVDGKYVSVAECGIDHLLHPAVPETKKTRLFISYAHVDGEGFKDKIIAQLESLRRQELVERWDDRMIGVGEWSPQIEAALEAADIFLLVITPGFLASDYIHSREIKAAYQKYRQGRAQIFPVICDYCDWMDYPISDELEIHPEYGRLMKIWLGKFQAFPKDGEPVVSHKWANQNQALLDVVGQLKKEILKGS